MKRTRLSWVWIGLTGAGLFAAGAAQAEPADKKTISVPAVSFTGQGGGEVEKPQPRTRSGRSAGGYIQFWHTPGHWLEWTVEGAAAGEYDLTLGYAGKHDVTRSLAVNGTPVEALKSFALKRTGRWSTWSEAKLPASVKLAAGRNVLRLTCTDDASVRLREIKLSGAGKKDIVVNATDFSGEGGSRVQALKPPTKGYVIKWGGDKHWLEWAVDAPAAGEYAVHLHYAADGYCPRELQVNGRPVKGLEEFILPPTGDERNWTVGKLPVAVALKAGRNTLRMTGIGGRQRGVPAVGGAFGLSEIRLVCPPGGDVEPVKLRYLKAVLAEQAEAKKQGPITPPAPLGPPPPAIEGAVALAEGQTFKLGGRSATVTKADVLPYVENKFSKRFVFENYDNPKLRRLREKYKLDEVIAGDADEMTKQAMLMKWVWDQWDFGHAQEIYYLRDPFRILDEAKRGHKFQCMHSGSVLLTTANSLGWVCRAMAIPRHTFCEIWSNQHRKWIMFDATSNYFPEKKGVPLNTYEQRQALLREGGGVMRGRMGEKGLERMPQSDRYGRRLLFIGYIPNTNFLDRGPDYGQFFITKDELCKGRGWHTRDCPEDPAKDPYFPINQAALALVPDGGALKVTIGTITPNFKAFQVRIDGGEWKASKTSFAWKPHQGANTLEAKSVNKFGVDGPVSTVKLAVEK